jgi:hypothetical protein
MLRGVKVVGVVAVSFAPAPDFRYVGLAPITARRFTSGASARMAIVPWGVLVDRDDAPRILRWAAVRRVAVLVSRVPFAAASPTRVAVETDRERFVGEAASPVRLDSLALHLEAYAGEQAAPLALDLRGDGEAAVAPSFEPSCEMLFSSARDYLASSSALTELFLPGGGYRRTSMLVPTSRTTEALRRILRDRTPKRADPRAFAAVLAGELGARELAGELVALTQCPHPLVAAVARQAARLLGASRSRTGTLEEVAPFLTWPTDRACLEAWR